MSNWFYAANGQQQGPFGDAQLQDLISNGTVRPDTLVWTEGMAGWQKAAEVPGLMPAGGPPPMPIVGMPFRSSTETVQGAAHAASPGTTLAIQTSGARTRSAAIAPDPTEHSCATKERTPALTWLVIEAATLGITDRSRPETMSWTTSFVMSASGKRRASADRVTPGRERE